MLVFQLQSSKKFWVSSSRWQWKTSWQGHTQKFAPDNWKQFSEIAEELVIIAAKVTQVYALQFVLTDL